ncbi:MAG: sel1 repeat family protein [Alphaproteobacteria bacterium]|nr:sel1 repeat family protein [Alphaproteobacteria bacterium]
MGRIVAIVALALGLAAGGALPGSAATQRDLEKGLELIGREHYTDAMVLLDPLARLEDREALYQTARLFEDNKGQQAQALDEHDRLAEAAQRYTHAAALGHADAAYRLGRIQLRGVGVARDPVAAAAWLRRAALADHGKAQFEFASLLATGIGVAQDEYAALTWYLIAAQRNDVSPAEPAAESLCDRLRRKLDLALEQRLRLERPDQRFQPVYTRPARIDQYALMPQRIRTAMDRAIDFTPEGEAADRGKPDMPDTRCFTGQPEG